MRPVVIAVAILFGTVAFAEEYGWDPASFDVSGYHVLKFRASVGGMTPAQRRLILEFRMPKVLTQVQYKQEVVVTTKRAPRGERQIFVNDVYFLTVTRQEAKACNSTVPTLAKQWAARIKTAFERVGPARQLPHTGAAKPVPEKHLD